MIKRCIIMLCFVATAVVARSQSTDTLPPVIDNDLAIDTSIDYDELLSDLDLFLDSLLAPRSYALASLSLSRGYFNFFNSAKTRIESVKKFTWSPTLAYYSKTGFGLSAAGSLMDDGNNFGFYQFSLSPSYDYIKDRRMAAGISYLRYFTKDSLPFYTSPLQNEVFGYFLWRKAWLQPGITFDYGWGSKTQYKERERFYQRLVSSLLVKRKFLRRLLSDSTTIIQKNSQSIVDFTTVASVRHDFYWLNVFSSKDYIRLTPLLSLTGGTQKFGYNQTTSTTGGISRINLLYNANGRNISLEDKFKLLSTSLLLRGEYAIGKFFLQPQLLLDYYFPANEDKFTALFSVNAGWMF